MKLSHGSGFGSPTQYALSPKKFQRVFASRTASTKHFGWLSRCRFLTTLAALMEYIVPRSNLRSEGGPCKYKGKDMTAAHAGMGISNGDFGALASMKSMIVEK
jgi:hypothetical protein